MRVLIDTNVILDALVGRQPYFENADKIIKMCADKQIEGCLAAHSISNILQLRRLFPRCLFVWQTAWCKGKWTV